MWASDFGNLSENVSVIMIMVQSKYNAFHKLKTETRW